MSFTLTKDGPIWEHIEGQWYRVSATREILCTECAAAWADAHAVFEPDGDSYAQTSGFIDPIMGHGTDVCAHCDGSYSRYAPMAAARLPLLLAMLLIMPACAHSSSYMVTTNDNQVVRCKNTDYSLGSRFPLGLSLYTGDECMMLVHDPKTGAYMWQAIVDMSGGPAVVRPASAPAPAPAPSAPSARR